MACESVRNAEAWAKHKHLENINIWTRARRGEGRRRRERRDSAMSDVILAGIERHNAKASTTSAGLLAGAVAVRGFK